MSHLDVLKNVSFRGKTLDNRTFGSTDRKIELIPRADVVARHQGLAECYEVCFELPEKNDHLPPLWFHAELHLSDAGKWYALWRVANDSANPDHAMGFQAMQFALMVNGVTQLSTAPVQQDDGIVELFDQTSCSGMLGEPFWAPDTEALAPYLATWKVDREKLDIEAIRKSVWTWWSKVDTRGEDHWNDTNITGSAGARYDDYRFLAWLLFPEFHKPAVPLLHWVLEQYGTFFKWSDGGEERVRFIAGRPYSLHWYEQNKSPRPFDRDLMKDRPFPVRFYSGTIQNRLGDNYADGVGLNTLGRVNLPVIDQGDYPYEDWVGTRLYGFPGTRPSRITARGRNGHDPEHSYRHVPTYTTCLLTSSIFARNLLECHAETGTAPLGGGKLGIGVEGLLHSSRTVGWNLNKYARAFHILKKPRYKSYVIGILDALTNRLSNGLLPDWVKDPAIILSRERQRQFWDKPGEPVAWTNEASWQATVVGEAALVVYDVLRGELTESEVSNVKALARDACRAAEACMTDQGMIENYRLNRDGTSEPMGSRSWKGTRHWTPNPGKAFDLEYARKLWEFYRSIGGHKGFGDDQRRTTEWHRRQLFDYTA